MSQSFSELNLTLHDTEWPMTFIDHDRQIVRAIVVDGAGRCHFVRAVRNDDFGAATLIETAGGGVEPGEALSEAIRRELREELGAEVEILGKIGVVSDYYNLIHRHNINHYYLCRALSFGNRRLTEDERELYHLSTLSLSFDEAEKEYARRACTPLGRLIAQRELPVLRRAKALMDEIDDNTRRNTPMKTIHTEHAPAAVGPYSQAISTGALVFTSGQIPLDPETGALVGTTIEQQAEQVMKNLMAVLAAAGTGPEKAVKTLCFLTDMNDFAAFNAVYAKYFTEKPARSCVQVSALPKGAMCEVEVVAAL